MHRIYRPWAAGRELRFFAPTSSPYCYCSCFLHKDVSVKRLRPFNRSARLVPFLRRNFTKSYNARLPGQAAQPSREADDEYDDTSRQYTSHRIASFPIGNTAPQHQASNGRLAEKHSHDQIPQNETHFDVPNDKGDITSNSVYREVPVNEEDFAKFNGFWGTQVSDPSGNTPTSDQSDQNIQSFSTSESILEEFWRGQPRHGKIDLSYWEPSRGELLGTYSENTKQEFRSRSTKFRDTGRSRVLVANFINMIFPHISSTTDLSNSATDCLLTHDVFRPIGTDIDVILEVFSWSWIVIAPPALRFKRLIHWSRSEVGHVTPAVPQWLVLQLLRSDRIDPGDLVDLLKLIDQKLATWDLKSSMMVLIVRLLRHARKSHPECFSRIVEIFMRLLDRYFSNEPLLEDARRRAHLCNRVLTLLALPVYSHPFKHVIVQQNVQLLLLHYMHDVSPVIPLNREGYRALVTLQLMHTKTDTERMWAEVQADTWPPWEKQHQMGVTSPPRASPGSTSRTNLVLHRMREDGYSPHTFDIAAQILGGRDSDSSPTAQVRRPPEKIPSRMSWLPGPDSTQFDKSPQIWLARITATRTVREAWMAFCAYENVAEENADAVSVYHAMFQKLWADTLPARSDTGPLPGDGLENFPDPELARDRVHVPEEPPSAQELYNRMTAKGIKTSGVLLRDLLLRETDLHRGLAYIMNSAIQARHKSVLGNPMIHSSQDVADKLRLLHIDTSEVYIGLLARPHCLRSEPKIEFQSDFSGKHIPGPVFALQVIQQTKLWEHETSVWSTYLEALSTHGLSSKRDKWSIGVKFAWELMGLVYTLKKRKLDAAALPHVLLTARNFQTWATPTVGVSHKPLDLATKFFLEAISGTRNDWTEGRHGKWCRSLSRTRPNLHSVPTADDIQEMAFLIVAAQEGSMIEDMLHLLHWTYVHQAQLTNVSIFTKHNLAAFRVFFEGQWATSDSKFMKSGLEIMTAQQDEINEAKEICQQLGGWASDEDVRQYLVSTRNLFTRLKVKLQYDAQIE